MHVVLKMYHVQCTKVRGARNPPRGSGRGRVVTTLAGSGVRRTGTLKCAVEMGKDGYVCMSYV